MNHIADINRKLDDKVAEIRNLKIQLNSSQSTTDELTARVVTLEEKVSSHLRTTETESATENGSYYDKKTLLLGDGNLRNIKFSDLKSECKIRTIQGGNIDVINCWVTEQLNWKPGKCVIYCGIEDVLEDKTPKEILDAMGILISSLKEINENIIIYVCELVPVVNHEGSLDKIKDFNRNLIEWCYDNNIHIIKTDLPFKVGTGEIDDMCIEYCEQSKECVLNRYGVIRLLDTIMKQYPNLAPTLSCWELDSSILPLTSSTGVLVSASEEIVVLGRET